MGGPSGGRPSRSAGRPLGGLGGSEALSSMVADVPPQLNDEWLPLPASAPLVVKGNHAAAIGGRRLEVFF